MRDHSYTVFPIPADLLCRRSDQRYPPTARARDPLFSIIGLRDEELPSAWRQYVTFAKDTPFLVCADHVACDLQRRRRVVDERGQCLSQIAGGWLSSSHLALAAAALSCAGSISIHMTCRRRA